MAVPFSIIAICTRKRANQSTQSKHQVYQVHYTRNREGNRFGVLFVIKKIHSLITMKLATFALMSVLSAPMIMGQEGTDGTTSYFEHIVNDKNDCDSKPMIALFGLLDGQCTPNFIAPDTCQQAIYNEATGQKISTQPWHRAICRPQTTAISKLSPPEGMLKSSGQDYLRVTGYTDANCTELWFDVYYRMDKQPKQENPLCARLLMEV